MKRGNVMDRKIENGNDASGWVETREEARGRKGGGSGARESKESEERRGARRGVLGRLMDEGVAGLVGAVSPE